MYPENIWTISRWQFNLCERLCWILLSYILSAAFASHVIPVSRTRNRATSYASISVPANSLQLSRSGNIPKSCIYRARVNNIVDGLKKITETQSCAPRFVVWTPQCVPGAPTTVLWYSISDETEGWQVNTQFDFRPVTPNLQSFGWKEASIIWDFFARG
jgi:hypothetical protein